MAETLSEIFERMLQKQQILVEKYNVLEEKARGLVDEKAELEGRLRKQMADMEKLRMENEYLKLARTVAFDRKDLDKNREIITKLVRDVEKCIEQLNEK